MSPTDRPVRLNLPARLEGLAELAYNLQWSWDPEATALWRDLARRAPSRGGAPEPLNPVRVLAGLPRRALERLAADDGLTRRIEAAARRLRSRPRPRASLERLITARRPVAYLSMEFAIQTSLPFYAGGLGILAGDHLKSASDLGLPLVGVGLAYREGYFRQEIDGRGRMKVKHPAVDYGRLPMEIVRDGRGRQIRVEVELPGRRGRTVRLRAWRLRTGHTSILLLDSDFGENPSRDRALTRRLYGGTREDRIAQESLAGIGGVRLLRALDLEPSVWHLNEGHVTFATLERFREMHEARRGRRSPLDLGEAVERVAADTVFTTHTPVPEGNEVFDLRLARRYLASPCEQAGIDVDDYLRLGLDRDPRGRPVLSMTVLAIRLSRHRNGVSRLHGEVSRRMWQHLWPGFTAEEAPIASVTNGVHVPTWIAPEMDDLFRQRISENWREQLDRPETWKKARRIPDKQLWECRTTLRRRLVDFVRERVAANLRRNGASEARARKAVEDLLDPEALTLGFARRFALYKRAALLFRNRTKARQLFRSTRRPVQIVFAGKPHPEDPAGKKLFEEIVAISRRAGFRGKVVVLENYDMDIGAAMVQGVDVWLNNPRRPLEASGTSGQKVPFNGGLNASVLDGWWDEGHEEGVGWAIGDRREYDDPDLQDRNDAASLHRVLARELLPLFYRRDRNGRPREWLHLVKQSMAELIPRFNTDHMVGEYRDGLYLPAARLGERVRRERGLAKDISAWRGEVERCWPLVCVRASRRRVTRRKPTLEVDLFVAGLRRGEVRARVLTREADGVAARSVRRVEDDTLRFQFALPRGAPEPIRVRFWPLHEALPSPTEAGLSFEAEI